MAHDVFISYSTKDKTIADAVCAKLEEHKIRVWIAPRDVPAGSKFAESIIRAINTCKVFVLIWSANTNTSDHILNEINQAFDQGITIIPFRIQDIQPTDEMRYYFGRTHWLDAITPPLENHIAILRDTILINLGRELQPVKPPVDSQGSSVEGIQEPITEKEPAIERAEAVKPPLKSSPQKKSQKIDTKIQPTGAAPANLTRFIPFAAGGLVVLTLVILLLSGVFKESPPAEIAQTSPAPTSSISPTSVIKPAETSTPVPAWMDEAIAVAEPILATIKKYQPDFEDDFSQVDTTWSYNPGDGAYDCRGSDETKIDVTDGSLKSRLGPDCPAAAIGPPGLQYDNYVLQLDVHFPGAPLGIELRNWGQSADDEDVQLHYSLGSPEGHWGLSRNGNLIEGMEGKVSLDFSKPVTITIINQSPTFIVYIDSSLITFYNSQEQYGRFGLDFVFGTGDVPPTETLTLEMDNFKIWDLDRIEEVNAMAELILTKINHFPSDFADDFSQVDPNWSYDLGACPDIDSTPMSVVDGEIHFTISPDCPYIGFTHPNFQFQSVHYVMQMDINFQKTNIVFEFGAGSSNGFVVDFILQDEGWATFEPIPNTDEMKTVGDGSVQSEASESVTLTIIKKATAFLFYLNSELLTVYDIQAEVAHEHEIGFAVNNWSCRDTCNPETILLDNVKVWDLNKIEESIAFSESILATVQDFPPVFADDFSQVDPNWVYGRDDPGLCPDASDVKMSITDGSMKYSIINCQVGNLHYADMHYGNYVLQLDINFQGAPLGLEFRNWGRSQDEDVQLDYHIHHDASWGFGIFGNGDFIEGIDGNYGLDFSKPVTITIINQSPTFIVYVDTALLTFYNTQEEYAGPFVLDFTVNSWDVTPSETLTLELDNIKIWDLDKIEY